MTPVCWKCTNSHGTVFIWCKEGNGRQNGSSYLRTFEDGVEDYESNYNFCPYCGAKLQKVKFDGKGHMICIPD